MKYASDYYGSLNTFSHAPSNMNRLCKDLEGWFKTQRYSSGSRDFDWTIMIDPSIGVEEDIQGQINALYLEFCKEMSALQHDQMRVRKYGDENLTSYDAQNFTINWGYYYDKYRDKCLAICPDIKKLANATVLTCYRHYPRKNNTKFMWRVAGEGIVSNIKQVQFPLPIRDNAGEYEYLGKKYSFEIIQGVDEQ